MRMLFMNNYYLKNTIQDKVSGNGWVSGVFLGEAPKNVLGWKNYSIYFRGLFHKETTNACNLSFNAKAYRKHKLQNISRVVSLRNRLLTTQIKIIKKSPLLINFVKMSFVENKTVILFKLMFFTFFFGFA